MNRALQWKLIAGFLLVFVAGGITGAFVGGSYARLISLNCIIPSGSAGE
jgi:hypothetical protein